MIAAMVLMGLIELTAHAGFRVDGSQPPTVTNTIAPGQLPQKQVPSRCAPAPYRFGEYRPASSYARPGMPSAKTDVHGWKQTDVAAHEMRWTSDAPTKTNDFWIFEYRPDKEIGEVSLEVGGGDLSKLVLNSNPNVKSAEGGFVLAVYEGKPPVALFKGSDPSFGTKLSWRWNKSGPIDLITTVKFSRPVKEFTIVLVGIDPSPDISVDLRLCRVRAFPTSSFTPKTKK
ncbi:MAG: hypothetical protein AABO41_24005 [Acidobacteriota bacterium]